MLDLRVEFRRARVEARSRRGNARRAEAGAAALAELGATGGLKLNVGSGPEALAGWTNLDIADLSGDVLTMDATRPWPLPDGSAVAVNSEHFLEHISQEEAAFYFREAHRVLGAGGVIRTSTPDMRGLIALYSEADPRMLEAHRKEGYAARNHGEMFNNYLYEWGHRHIYDLETLTEMLSEAGFEQIERAAFGESNHQLLRGIDTHGMGELQSAAIAVDAVKPQPSAGGRP
jgi:predicted SAM-dependent methyltransferase